MKGRLAPFVLACFAALLCIWPLTLQRPGLPLGLKADEAAYFLMARSLWEDHDLVCEKRDLLRISDDFVNDADNLILMTPNDGGVSYYAKPYFGSLLAAPFVAAFGPRGFISFNMMLLLGATLLGWLYLRVRNEEAEALFFAVSYFFISVSWEYVYWLQPEIFCLFCVSATLFLTMASRPEPPPGGRAPLLSRVFLGDWSRWLWAGLLIGPAANAKPVYLAALLPGIVAGLVAPTWRRKIQILVLYGFATVVSVGGIAVGQKVLTGTWSPYLGLKRQGVNVRNPYSLWVSHAKAASEPETPEEPAATAPGEGVTTPTPTPGGEATAGAVATPGEAAPPAGGGSSPSTVASLALASPTPTLTEEPCEENVMGTYWWVLRWPGVQWQRVGLDIRNYLIGRHTGAFVWYPFLLVGILYFLVGGGVRSPQRWGALAGLVLFAAWFLIFNYHNYHGGGGFIGNRYLVGMYPVGLYAVDRIRPRALQILGFVLGGLFLGQVLFAPLGPLVEEGTLQVYVRAVPFRWLPFEFTLPRQIPGYRGVGQEHAHIEGRKDQVKQNAEWLRVLGDAPAQLFMTRYVGARTAAFLVKSWAPGNEVKISIGGEKAIVRFPEGDPPVGGTTSVAVLPLGEPDEIFQEFARRDDRCDPFVGSTFEGKWYLTVTPRHAVRPAWFGDDKDETLVGAEILYIGEAERLTRNVFSSRIYDVDLPPSVIVDTNLEVPLSIANTSVAEWANDSPVRVNLSYRVLDPKTQQVVEDGIRTRLPALVRPGEWARVSLRLVAPGAPGDYILAIEPVYEYVNWFGAVNPATVQQVPLHVVGRGAAAP